MGEARDVDRASAIGIARFIDSKPSVLKLPIPSYLARFSR